MAPTYIDHITVTASTLEAGALAVEQALGARALTGGTHPRMGTHNLLLRLGDTLFLEIIAIHPEAPAPERPRWFDLDRRDPLAAPGLSTWVVRSEQLAEHAAAASEDLGPLEPMSRGALTWHLTIPADGSVPLSGVAPAVIEWHTERHPAAGMAECGLSLVELLLVHPDPERVQRLLRSLNLQGPVRVRACEASEGPHLQAWIQTPSGLRQLTGAMPVLKAG
ncbi:MAG: hypothetical protein RLZ66_2129 [Pseudomonadota bacterium]